MNKEILYSARKSMVGSKFLRRILIGVLGAIIMILGLVMINSIGASAGFIILIFGLTSMVIGGLAALIEALVRRSNTIDFYKDRYVVKSGILNKKENQVILTHIIGTSIHQKWFETLVNSGTVKINIVGKGDITLDGVKNPTGLKNYLESIIQQTDYSKMNQVIHE